MTVSVRDRNRGLKAMIEDLSAANDGLRSVVEKWMKRSSKLTAERDAYAAENGRLVRITVGLGCACILLLAVSIVAMVIA